MKTAFKVLMLLLAVLILVSGSLTVSADSRVTYDGNAKKFVFETASDATPTDLFENFKDIMPGDRITQAIRVKNDVKNDVKIKLYLKSAGATAQSADFLSKLHLTVLQNGDSTLFSAPADETGALTEWTCLGTFYSGADIDLDVILEAPLTLDDTFQDAVGTIDWQFRVEELPIEPGDPQAPQTGESVAWLLCAGLACVIGCVGIALLVSNKRRTTV